MTAYIQTIESYYNYQSLLFYLFDELHVNLQFIFVKFSGHILTQSFSQRKYFVISKFKKMFRI